MSHLQVVGKCIRKLSFVFQYLKCKVLKNFLSGDLSARLSSGDFNASAEIQARASVFDDDDDAIC